MQKQIPNLPFPVQFYWITPFCSKYFVQDCRLRDVKKELSLFVFLFDIHGMKHSGLMQNYPFLTFFELTFPTGVLKEL